MIKIILIGAGQLGSRHLQALAKNAYPLAIDVVDSSSAALDVAKARYDEITPTATNARFLTDIPKGESYAVAIVATSSMARAAVVRGLYARADVEFLVLEKFLFPAMEEYDEIGALIEGRSSGAWVNCPRRMYRDYAALKEAFACEPLTLSVSGGQWGMGCNAVHFADLAAYLSGTCDITYDTSHLDGKLHPSNRAGYVELSGVLFACVGTHSFLTLSAYSQSSAPHIIQITSTTRQVVIDECGGNMTVWDADTQWRPEARPFAIAYQSNLSHLFVDDIVHRRQCSLTPYSESKIIHRSFLKAITECYPCRELFNKEGFMPIT